jgi:TP901 family phage tail tape measure protein
MPAIYSIALKLSLEGVNQLKNQFSVVTQEIRKTSNNLTNITKNSFRQLKELTTGSIGQLVSLGVVTVALRDSIRTGIEFEDTFLRATAKIKDGVIKDSIEFNKLSNLVKELGANTEFSTAQAAQGLDFWAKAGKTTNEIMELLPKSLDMATASGLDLARASDILSDALGLFNMNAKDMNQLSVNANRIMDNMSKTATMTNTSIEELFETSKIAGGIFTSAGQSMETFNASAAILADNSMKGSIAGTNLRAIMAKLVSPVERARKTLNILGISIKDNKGNMRDLADILDDLKTATDKYGNAERLAIFKILAGQEAMNGLNFLVKEGGDRLRYYREQLEQSNGTTEKLANTFRTTTKITLDNFTSAIA